MHAHALCHAVLCLCMQGVEVLWQNEEVDILLLQILDEIPEGALRCDSCWVVLTLSTLPTLCLLCLLCTLSCPALRHLSARRSSARRQGAHVGGFTQDVRVLTLPC